MYLPSRALYIRPVAGNPSQARATAVQHAQALDIIDTGQGLQFTGGRRTLSTLPDRRSPRQPDPWSRRLKSPGDCPLAQDGNDIC